MSNCVSDLRGTWGQDTSFVKKHWDSVFKLAALSGLVYCLSFAFQVGTFLSFNLPIRLISFSLSSIAGVLGELLLLIWVVILLYCLFNLFIKRSRLKASGLRRVECFFLNVSCVCAIWFGLRCSSGQVEWTSFLVGLGLILVGGVWWLLPNIFVKGNLSYEEKCEILKEKDADPRRQSFIFSEFLGGEADRILAVVFFVCFYAFFYGYMQAKTQTCFWVTNHEDYAVVSLDGEKAILISIDSPEEIKAEGSEKLKKEGAIKGIMVVGLYDRALMDMHKKNIDRRKLRMIFDPVPG